MNIVMKFGFDLSLNKISKFNSQSLDDDLSTFYYLDKRDEKYKQSIEELTNL